MTYLAGKLLIGLILLIAYAAFMHMQNKDPSSTEGNPQPVDLKKGMSEISKVIIFMLITLLISITFIYS